MSINHATSNSKVAAAPTLSTFSKAGDGGRKPESLSRLVIAILVVMLILLFPGHPDQFTLNTLLQMPLELPVIVVALLLVPAVARPWLSALLAVLALVLMLLRLADIGSYLAFNRRFNPILELHLISDGWNLASTSTGPVQALLIATIAILLLLLIVWFVYRCLLRISQTSTRLRSRLMLAAILTALFIGAGLFAENRFQYKGPAQAQIIPEFNFRLSRISHSIADQRAFVEQLRSDSVLDVGVPEFSALQGKDVIVVFVESYGRGYLDAERFSSMAINRLAEVQTHLEKNNRFSKSGWLTSPIRGGRSWLAHATFQAGLKIDNQARFDRLVTSTRPSLTALFEMAGWDTVGIMPAIQFSWPEGSWYDYQRLFVAEDLDYQGERFGYATMPDQYTLSHFQQTIREPSNVPVMATIALVSTHAPWTPLPDILDWDAIGDGSIFDGSHRYGEKISWKYRSKVQDMYAQSFDYTLNVLGEYAARYGDNAVIIILGDHQPAPIINGWGKSGDVPVHIITSDTDILERLPSGYWSEGMIPSGSLQSLPMQDVRKTWTTLFK